LVGLGLLLFPQATLLLLVAVVVAVLHQAVAVVVQVVIKLEQHLYCLQRVIPLPLVLVEHTLQMETTRNLEL
jgi:hypothetical protein